MFGVCDSSCGVGALGLLAGWAAYIKYSLPFSSQRLQLMKSINTGKLSPVSRKKMLLGPISRSES